MSDTHPRIMHNTIPMLWLVGYIHPCHVWASDLQDSKPDRHRTKLTKQNSLAKKVSKWTINISFSVHRRRFTCEPVWARSACLQRLRYLTAVFWVMNQLNVDRPTCAITVTTMHFSDINRYH